MEIPPPSVPEARLADWRQTDQTVESPFSTPMVSVYTHTLVFEESTQRAQIHAETGVDHPWRFFFTSRIQLDPAQPPNPVLGSLIRSRASRAFADRLADRGLDDISKGSATSVSLGHTKAKRTPYTARLTLDVAQTEPLSIPLEAVLTTWTDDGYRLAGGAYPAGRATSGPSELVESLITTIEPQTAREELAALVAGCAD